MATAVPAWVAPYVGLPFVDGGRGPAAFDCWGLVRQVLRDRAGVELPAWDGYADVEDGGCIGPLVAAARGELVHVDDPREHDLVLFRGGGEGLWHVGACVGAPWFLHTQRGLRSAVESWERLKWRRRVEGFYRCT